MVVEGVGYVEVVHDEGAGDCAAAGVCFFGVFVLVFRGFVEADAVDVCAAVVYKSSLLVLFLSESN